MIVSVNGEEVAKERFTQYFINAYNREYATQQYYQQLGMVQQISVNRDKVLKNTADAVVRIWPCARRARSWAWTR